jgi:hypothetical protein
MFHATLFVAALVTTTVPVQGGVPAERVPLGCDTRHTLVVPVSVAGTTPRPFLLDTGASISTIDQQLARRLGLAMIGRIPSWSGTDLLAGAQLTIGAVRLPAAPVASVDLSRLSPLVGDVAGILGSDALRAMGRATIDVDRCALTIGETVDEGVVPDSPLRAPIEWHEGRPVVTMAGGGRLLLDSGATTLTVFTGTAAAVALRFESGGGSLVRIDRVDGSRVGRLGRIASLSIGGVHHYNVPAIGVRSWYDEADTRAPDGLLPLGLFSRVHISRSGGYVVLVPRSH